MWSNDAVSERIKVSWCVSVLLCWAEGVGQFSGLFGHGQWADLWLSRFPYLWIPIPAAVFGEERMNEILLRQDGLNFHSGNWELLSSFICISYGSCWNLTVSELSSKVNNYFVWNYFLFKYLQGYLLCKNIDLLRESPIAKSRSCHSDSVVL